MKKSLICVVAIVVCLMMVAGAFALPTGNVPTNNKPVSPGGYGDDKSKSDAGDTYEPMSTTNQNDESVPITTAPEPSTLFLIGAGLIALGFIVRYKQRVV